MQTSAMLSKVSWPETLVRWALVHSEQLLWKNHFDCCRLSGLGSIDLWTCTIWCNAYGMIHSLWTCMGATSTYRLSVGLTSKLHQGWWESSFPEKLLGLFGSFCQKLCPLCPHVPCRMVFGSKSFLCRRNPKGRQYIAKCDTKFWLHQICLVGFNRQ